MRVVHGQSNAVVFTDNVTGQQSWLCRQRGKTAEETDDLGASRRQWRRRRRTAALSAG